MEWITISLLGGLAIGLTIYIGTRNNQEKTSRVKTTKISLR